MKKRVKRQLKEDEFISTINKIFNFAKKRWKELAAAGVVVLIVGLVFLGAKMIKTQKTGKQSDLLGKILKVSSALKDNPGKVEELEKLAGSGKFTRLAYIKLAIYWDEKGEMDKALDLLAKLSPGRKDLFYYQAQDLMAQIYIEQKNYDKAIDIYKKIEEENPKEYTLDVVLFKMAQAHEEKGEIKEALALYNRVKDEFPQTYYGYDASKKAEKLGSKK